MSRKSRAFPSILLMLLALLLLLPPLITIYTSFAGPAWVDAHYKGQGRALWTPGMRLSLAQYSILLGGADTYGGPLLASLGYATFTTGAHLVISLVAAFCLAKVKMRGFGLITCLYLVAMALPAQVLLLPSFVVLDLFSLTDSWFSLYITAIFAPFGVFFLRQALTTLPDSLIEAALLETSGTGKLLFRVVAPSISSSMIALGALAFTEAWNAVEQPLILLSPRQVMPISIILVNMVRYGNIEAVFAYSAVAIVPVAVLYLAARRSLFASMENFHF